MNSSVTDRTVRWGGRKGGGGAKGGGGGAKANYVACGTQGHPAPSEQTKICLLVARRIEGEYVYEGNGMRTGERLVPVKGKSITINKPSSHLQFAVDHPAHLHLAVYAEHRCLARRIQHLSERYQRLISRRIL